MPLSTWTRRLKHLQIISFSLLLLCKKHPDLHFKYQEYKEQVTLLPGGQTLWWSYAGRCRDFFFIDVICLGYTAWLQLSPKSKSPEAGGKSGNRRNLCRLCIGLWTAFLCILAKEWFLLYSIGCEQTSLKLLWKASSHSVRDAKALPTFSTQFDVLLIEDHIKKKLQSKVCFARSYRTDSYFKSVNLETNLAILLLPSPACSVVYAPSVTHLVILI